MSQSQSPIDPDVVAELERSKNEVLKRVAEKLKKQMDVSCVTAKGHTSHSSGNGGRTHASNTTH